MTPISALRKLTERPYLVIFGAAVALSTHGLFLAATSLGRITPALAWLYVVVIDALAVSAYRTWRSEYVTRTHWAGGVALALAVFTVTLNVLGIFPRYAASWVGPLIAGFPPVAALLATALRVAEDRLVSATELPSPVEGDIDTTESTRPAEPPPLPSSPPPTQASGYPQGARDLAISLLGRGDTLATVAATIHAKYGRRPTPKTLRGWRDSAPTSQAPAPHLEAVR